MTARIEINYGSIGKIDAALSRLEAAGRLPVLKRGLRSAGKVVEQRTQQILPQPGYPGDKEGLKPLRDTLGTKVGEYRDGRFVVATTGYEWGAGSHGHMVEHGHKMVVGGTAPQPGKGRKLARKAASGFRGTGRVVGFVKGKHYLEMASQASRAEQDAAIQSAIKQAFEESLRV